MTTIAWDGKELACDSLLSAGGCVVPSDRVQKVFELPDGRLFAGSGRYAEVLMTFDWLRAGCKEPKPHLKEMDGIIVSTKGAEYIDDLLRPWPVNARYYAVGSGQDFANVAMELGKTAKQAVAIAMKFDRETGGQIHTFVPKKVPRKRVTQMKRAA